ncbi:MCE family protein [Mycolicibacterium holsaticum]|uniref:Mammalian cell entry protein n=1 Tax=Mycolicibacterium holsaticum TaxID=152142 RepID=A0A1E3RZ37_9MYCO|nr:MlaD family protein [Mycolicibacterium holsaticum]ODQ95110.1 mammalian cell entry protein [Mycolicibacterium holsaticum]
MRIGRRILFQLIIFGVVAAVAGAIMVFGYIRLPARWFGLGQYTVTVELPAAAGLYKTGNVTYRGTEVGRVADVRLTDTGVVAVLSLRSDIPIPSDLDADVRSHSAAGEQYVALSPRNATSRPLENGDVIPLSRAAVPPDVNALLDATNRGLQAIPRADLKTVVDESYTAVGGLGPEIARIVKGSTQLAIDAHAHLDAITQLVDQASPALAAQADTGYEISAWASHLRVVTDELRSQDAAVAGLLERGGPAIGEVEELIERLQPTLPIVLANLVAIDQVAITYQAAIEQLLVLMPQSTAALQATIVSGVNTKQDYKGSFLDFNLNINLPPPCTTGYLPAQQQRPASFEDYPDRPAGDLYCRVPQDSPFNVRGARNFPCQSVPGKRAPTVRLCESDEQYVPLNDGFNWKGDPNATLSGQDVPQAPAPTARPPGPDAPIAVAEYDPATGTYLGPDGRVYTQRDLARNGGERTWQSMIVPPS